MRDESECYFVKSPKGQSHAVRVRRSVRAKRINLKIDTKERIAELVLPIGISVTKGLKFAQANAGWIDQHLENLPEKQSLCVGGRVPFKGTLRTLVHAPHLRSGKIVDRPDPQIEIGGPVLGFELRAERFLKTHARQTLLDVTAKAAEEMGVKPKIIRLKDTKSRWGSCSSAGALNYSWRLIFTPPEVLRYVVIHECAHLIEMNHSAAFWAIVGRHDPCWQVHRAWLREHGSALHAIG